ncbi:calcium-binding protein [Rhizobium sp. GN54]|uniref:calcium-binding protein n=1 Tax=Rhizobium sp. GN54 TaxID=2898150 RepID=UPI001E496B26|nr:calcium-binding protein [Rhizobium sp. GN54]MCD2183556.1 hypothetical protein [Rhizobium sp. GN54]
MAIIVGNLYRNTLRGSSEGDDIKGLGGDDSIFGGFGNDTLDGGTGDDVIHGYPSDVYYRDWEKYSAKDWSRLRDDDVIDGDSGNDRIYDYLGTNIIRAGAGDDFVGTRFIESSPLPVSNTVDLGSGNDSIDAWMRPGDALALDGGDGTDFAYFNLSNFTANLTLTLSASAKFGNADITMKNIEQIAIISGSGDDTFTGGDNVNDFQGGGGNDRLVGGKADDILSGEDGDDILEGGKGADFLGGGLGNDTISAGSGSDVIISDPSHSKDWWRYSEEDWSQFRDDDTIDAGNGNDFIEDFAGTNTIFAGAGNDVVRSSRFTYLADQHGSGPRVVSPIALKNTIDLGSGRDVFEGTLKFGDSLVLDGGSGTDRAVIDLGGYVSASGEPDPDLKFVLSSSARVIHAEVFLKNIEKIDITGGDGNDSFTGGALNDKLFGGRGNDTLKGGAGNDILGGGSGKNRLVGGAGDDFYQIDNRSDKIIEGRDEGIDLVRVNFSGKSYLLPENVENLRFIGNNATLVGNNLANVIDARRGGPAVLKGAAGDDTIYGSASHDTLDGGTGSDTITGGRGNDILKGGKGHDTLIGGAGKDMFVFKSLSDLSTSKAKTDTICDFSQKAKDLIDLTAIDAVSTKSGNQAFAFIGADKFSKSAGELRYTKEKADTYVYGDVDGNGKADFVIHIDGFVNLKAGDFLL